MQHMSMRKDYSKHLQKYTALADILKGRPHFEFSACFYARFMIALSNASTLKAILHVECV